MKRRILSLFLVLLTVFSLASAAMAAETSSKSPEWELEGNGNKSQASVDVYLTAQGATNGRFVLHYDPEVLTYASAEAGSSKWIVSVDAETEGEVAFAWVGSKLTAARTRMVTVCFTTKMESYSTVVTAEAKELYQSGKELEKPEDASEVLSNIPVVPGTAPGGSDGSGESGKKNPFTDIDGHWAEDEILAAYEAGLVNGLGDGKFGPDVALNRAMFATLLYRLAGEPKASGTNPFADVAAGQYYEDAVIWAYSNGVVTGTSDTTFSPDMTLTREQMVTMLYRYAKWAGMSISGSAKLDGFTDAASVSAYAVEAMQWAVANSIIKGQGNALAPAGTTTRAQAAAVLVRFAG